jgi:LemA protein
MVSDTVKYVAIGIVAFIIVAIGLGVLWFIGTHNDLVNKDNSVENARAHVQSAYQRRADLIPQLVGIVQGSADFEKSTLVELTQMRSEAGNYPQKMSSAKSFQEMQDINTEMGSFLTRLMVVVEAYPQIRTTEAFLTMQNQVEGSENRINTERNYYNDAVQVYKNACQQIPSSFVADYYGFKADKWKMFEAKPGADIAPTISFNFDRVVV